MKLRVGLRKYRRCRSRCFRMNPGRGLRKYYRFHYFRLKLGAGFRKYFRLRYFRLEQGAGFRKCQRLEQKRNKNRRDCNWREGW